MGEYFLDGKVRLFEGDSRDVLKGLADNSIDSVVTDPPYALVSIVKRFGGENAAPAKGNDAYQRASAGFMGKQWDTGETAFAVEFWAEVMRVLKPGGHVVAASGTRTYHRLAVAIDDAGFEIRDMISWNYSTGFPKSHDVIKKLKNSGMACACHKTIVSNHYVSEENLRDLQNGMDANQSLSGCEEQNLQSEMRRESDIDKKSGEQKASVKANRDEDGELQCLQKAVLAECETHQQSGGVNVLAGMQRGNPGKGVGDAWPQGTVSPDSRELREGGNARTKKPSVEGRRDDKKTQGELQGGTLCQSARLGKANGPQGRLHHGASLGDGEDVRLSTDADGNSSSQGSQSSEQPSKQLGVVADKRGSQAWGGWPVCNGCGKPVVPEGYGTALKPATEPWVLARKPLIGTVAGNVLAHGCGALNIDGCRVGEETLPAAKGEAKSNGKYGDRVWDVPERTGRWPANVIHDGSDEVVAGFPYRKSTGGDGYKNSMFFGGKSTGGHGLGDEGSAARFFYSAKADAMDRAGSKHPTVKPVDLMQYLCRLITPPGGVVLDPFAGSGSTGEAAWREGFQAILIERESEYAEDIRDRLKSADQGTAGRKLAIAKKKPQEPLGGLFEGL